MFKFVHSQGFLYRNIAILQYWVLNHNRLKIVGSIYILSSSSSVCLSFCHDGRNPPPPKNDQISFLIKGLCAGTVHSKCSSTALAQWPWATEAACSRRCSNDVSQISWASPALLLAMVSFDASFTQVGAN